MIPIRSPFNNVKNLIKKRLKKKCLDVWTIYHGVVEHHWKPSDIMNMEPWELAIMMAIQERYAQEIDRISKKY